MMTSGSIADASWRPTAAVCRDVNGVAARAQRGVEDLADHRLVVDDEDDGVSGRWGR